jgi:hypothetical protein
MCIFQAIFQESETFFLNKFDLATLKMTAVGPPLFDQLWNMVTHREDRRVLNTSGTNVPKYTGTST